MVIEHHQVTRPKTAVNPAGSISEDNVLYAQRGEHAHSEGDGFHPLAFVQVGSAKKHDDVGPADRACEELPVMARNGRTRKPANRGIGHLQINIHFSLHPLVTRAENPGKLRRSSETAKDGGSGAISGEIPARVGLPVGFSLMLH
jgi:hypothetical protein